MDVMLRLPRWARLGLRVLLVLLALSAITWLVLDFWSRQRLKRNASQGLSAACLLLRSISEPPSASSFPYKEVKLDQVDADLLAQAEEWLDSREEHRLALAILDLDASTRRALYVDGHITQIFAGQTRYNYERVMALRIAGLLKARALIRSRTGEMEAAYRDVALILRLANHLSRGARTAGDPLGMAGASRLGGMARRLRQRDPRIPPAAARARRRRRPRHGIEPAVRHRGVPHPEHPLDRGQDGYLYDA